MIYKFSNLNNDKEKYEIIYVSDKELGIDANSSKIRPCILLNDDYEECGYGEVIPMTTQSYDFKNNENNYKLANGSYINLNSSPIQVDPKIIKYSESAMGRVRISMDDILTIEDYFA